MDSEVTEQVAAESDWDESKVFVSRIPPNFDESSVKRLIETKLEEDSVINVSLLYPKDEAMKKEEEMLESKDEKNPLPPQFDKQQSHRGFAFVTLKNATLRQRAIDLGKIRGGSKVTSTKKFTIYLRPVCREDEAENKELCYLWINKRCPYGDKCKFLHKGEGGCIEKKDSSSKPKKKCFAFKKGKCKLGSECPYSHDFQVTITKDQLKERTDSEKDCINWKTKGKCRKRDTCPYRHDESVLQAFLKKKKRKRDSDEKAREKNRQPLSVRVYGLNYETTEDDVKQFFVSCGPIVEITFPKFEDSGRSKGYCGVLFQSPKAVAKATKLDGKELHGRWLRIQAGKMYLKQWEGHHSGREEPVESKSEDSKQLVGEFGQKVKRRKKHGYKE